MRILTCSLAMVGGIVSGASEFRMQLPTAWTLRSDDGSVAIEAHVPGCVQLDIHRAGLGPHPALDPHAAIFGWAESRTWTYEVSFEAPSMVFDHHRVDMVLEGLDTHAEVRLNGEPILIADNMFRTWRVDVKGSLRRGANTMQVVLRPSVVVGRAARVRSGLPLPHDSDTSGAAPFVRKAAYQFGWDFAPRLVTVGIHKPVYLHAWSDLRIDGLRIDQRSDPDGHRVTVVPVCEFATGTGEDLRAVLRWDGAVVNTAPFDARSGAAPELNRVDTTGSRWWPRGAGERTLHQLTVEVMRGERVLARKEQALGLRTVELDRSPDAFGTAYRFVINGRPLFMRGANVVPPGPVPSDLHDSAWVALVKHAQRAEMNMLRVWAGGVYPPDAFFRACDTAGILVWQDLMFAQMIPDDGAFLRTAGHEVREQALRIGGYTCLASWCGNNELEVAWKNWGWQQRYAMDHSQQQRIALAQQHFFHDSLPRWLQVAGERPYVPTTPLSNWGHAEGLRHGSLHYWGVWHADSTFSSYSGNVGRFVSEFGFQSYPDADPFPGGSESQAITLLRARQGSYRGDGPIHRAIQHEFGQAPDDERQWAIWSQLAQAQAMRMAICAHRANEPRCMGSLLWQLNDVWPAPSWSVVDHRGRWKPALYAVTKAYRPLALALDAGSQGVRITAVHPHTSEHLTMRARQWSLDGSVRFDSLWAVPGGNAGSSWVLSIQQGRGGDGEVLFVTLRDAEGQEVTEAIVPRPTAGVELRAIPLRTERVDAGTTRVIITAEGPAAMVHVSAPGAWMEDNGFPLLPHEQHHLLLHHPSGWDASVVRALAWP